MDDIPIGSHLRFRALWQRYEHIVRWRCLLAARGNTEKARDMIQESALRLLTYCDTLTNDVTKSASRKWLIRVVDSAIAAYCHKEQNVTSLNVLADTAVDTHVAEIREILDDLMSDLCDTERQFMQLYIEGYDLNDLSIIFEIDYNAAATRLSRIRRKMTLRARQQHYII